MELRHLRYFACVGEAEHFGRAAKLLKIAQPALSRQIQDLEAELGVALFDRLPRGVRLNAVGRSFLDDARRILREVNEAKLRVERIAAGQTGTLRVGFGETQAWHGAVPDSLRAFREQHPTVELELHAMASSRQVDAVSSGNLDAGFIFSLTKPPSEFAHRNVARHKLVLAAPKDHPIMSLDSVRLRELRDVPFIWFHRWVYPRFHDRLIRACLRDGALAPQIVQQVTDHATMLSLVSCRLGVAFVSEATRWQCPAGVALRPVDDLNFSLPFYLIWKKNNSSTLLREFLENVWTVTNARDS